MRLILAEAGAGAGAWAAAASCVNSCAAHKLASGKTDHFVRQNSPASQTTHLSGLKSTGTNDCTSPQSNSVRAAQDL